MNIKMNAITNIPGQTIDYIKIRTESGKLYQLSCEKSEYKQIGKNLYEITFNDVNLGYDVKNGWINATGKINELNNCTIEDIAIYRQVDTDSNDIFVIRDLFIEDEHGVNAACYGVNVGKVRINNVENMFKNDNKTITKEIEDQLHECGYTIYPLTGFDIHYETGLPMFNVN